MDKLFFTGRTYDRKEDIHRVYGGNMQAGIITTKDGPVFLISAPSGAVHGYHGYSDQTREDGILEYTGQGRTGDQKFNKTNLSVLCHSENGKELLHFTQIKAGKLQFNGSYVYESYRIERMPDQNKEIRDVIVFELRALDAIATGVIETLPKPMKADLATLRKEAYAAAKRNPKQREPGSAGTVFERSCAVRDYVLARAQGTCEHCDQSAPFITPNGVPFLEAHHIRRLSDGGPDDPRFVIGICPNCHRHAHYGADAKIKNAEMLKIVEQKETT